MSRRNRHPSCCAPYPEMVEPERGAAPYRIEDSNGRRLPSNGMVNQQDRWMFVPLDRSGRPVTRHELAHVHWSPPKLPRVRFDPRVLLAVEDARINLGLRHLRLPVELDVASLAQVRLLAAEDEKRGDLFGLVLRSVASLGTGAEDDLSELAAGLGPRGQFVAERMAQVRTGLERSRVRQRGPVASFRAGQRLARQLARELRRAGLLDARMRSDSERADGCWVVHGGSSEDGSFALKHPEGPGPGFVDRGTGHLRVARVPLPVNLRHGRANGRGWGARREGSVVRYVHRWTTDRAIFRGRRQRAGGTVLVDTSGSMSLSVEDLEGLLRATPAGACVAIYSGRGAQGELRIVASGSRRARAEQLQPYARGNVVDEPALEWLAGQAEPRIWVSDGHVTGVGDKPSASVKDACRRIRRRARVKRVDTPEEAARVLGGSA